MEEKELHSWSSIGVISKMYLICITFTINTVALLVALVSDAKLAGIRCNTFFLFIYKKKGWSYREEEVQECGLVTCDGVSPLEWWSVGGGIQSCGTRFCSCSRISIKVRRDTQLEKSLCCCAGPTPHWQWLLCYAQLWAVPLCPHGAEVDL